MNLTKNEEDYLKAMFKLAEENENQHVGTNELATFLGVSPASVNGMVKKLKIKTLVSSEKYGKLELTNTGQVYALRLIRKHRLWETFLCNHLGFQWDEVHQVAEQLEHVQSEKLITELDQFLGFPTVDPHGDIIPDAEGNYAVSPKVTLAELTVNTKCKLTAVKDGSVAFLKYVTEIGLVLSSEIEVTELREFDGSMQIKFDGKVENVSKKFAENIFVERK